MELVVFLVSLFGFLALGIPIAIVLVPVSYTHLPLQEGEARISSSVGVAFHSLEAATPARLLKNADVAMYRANGEGRDRLWRYRPSTFSDSGYGRVF